MSEQTRARHAASTTLAVALALFQICTALFGMLPSIYQRSIHWGLLALLGCSWNLETAWQRRQWGLAAADVILAAAAALSTLHICLHFEEIALRMGNLTPMDLLCGAALLLSVLGISFWLNNKALVFLTVACMLYGVWEALTVGYGLTVERILSFLYLGTDGIYGTALGVSTNYIYLFVMLGAFIGFSGAGDYFVTMARHLTARFRSGAAQTSLVAGGLLGMISGSGVANAVTVGSLAIPLMEESGYTRLEAAAIQAVTTNVAQLLPPVMGGVMFLAVDSVGTGYARMARVVILPAVAYCLVLGVVLWLQARSRSIASSRPATQERRRHAVWQGLLYLAPILCMVGLMLRGASAIKAGIYAVLLTMAIGVAAKLYRRTLRLSEIAGVFEKVGRMVLGVTPTCACAGIIITVMTLTNVGPKLTDLIVAASGGRLYVGLILMMLLTLLMGMFLPSSAVYLVLAALGVPSLVEMGAPFMVAHMFIIFFAVMAPITPPVALSAAAVAALTQEDFRKICFAAMRFALPLAVIPFVFVCYEGMLLEGSVWDAVLSMAMCLCAGTAAAAAVQGWLGCRLAAWQRCLSGALAVGMLVPAGPIRLASAAVWIVMALAMALMYSREARGGGKQCMGKN
ncbi:MAG: TRAP transporter fused permease subunit [Ruminococcaceae bacterium]|nr:TRAP transporter fused permease subunit [Oscillospiraceae bacterium]